MKDSSWEMWEPSTWHLLCFKKGKRGDWEEGMSSVDIHRVRRWRGSQLKLRKIFVFTTQYLSRFQIYGPSECSLVGLWNLPPVFPRKGGVPLNAHLVLAVIWSELLSPLRRLVKCLTMEIYLVVGVKRDLHRVPLTAVLSSLVDWREVTLTVPFDESGPSLGIKVIGNMHTRNGYYVSWEVTQRGYLQ